MPSPEAVPPPLPLSSDIALVLLSLGCAILGVTEVTRKPDTGQGERGLGVIEPQVPSTSRMALEVKFLTCIVTRGHLISLMVFFSITTYYQEKPPPESQH